MTTETNNKIVSWGSDVWNGIKTTADKGAGFFKRSFIIMTLVSALCGAIGYVYYLDHKSQQTQVALEAAEQKAEALRAKTEEVIEINKHNQEIVTKLQADQEKMDALVSTVNEQLVMNSRVISAIGTKVSTLKDGDLAPVLRETIRDLQALRVQRVK